MESCSSTFVWALFAISDTIHSAQTMKPIADYHSQCHCCSSFPRLLGLLGYQIPDTSRVVFEDLLSSFGCHPTETFLIIDITVSCGHMSHVIIIINHHTQNTLHAPQQNDRNTPVNGLSRVTYCATDFGGASHPFLQKMFGRCDTHHEFCCLLRLVVLVSLLLLQSHRFHSYSRLKSGCDHYSGFFYSWEHAPRSSVSPRREHLLRNDRASHHPQAGSTTRNKIVVPPKMRLLARRHI